MPENLRQAAVSHPIAMARQVKLGVSRAAALSRHCYGENTVGARNRT